MTADRVVQLRWEARTVAVEDLDGRSETVSYPGIALAHQCADQVVTHTWVPVGEEPTFSDDEVLIAALRDAWRWNQEAM